MKENEDDNTKNKILWKVSPRKSIQVVLEQEQYKKGKKWFQASPHLLSFLFPSKPLTSQFVKILKHIIKWDPNKMYKQATSYADCYI